MIRILAALCALAVIAAATHKNVLAGGGWASPDAAFIVAVAALLAVGTAFAAATWSEGRRIAASLVLLGVVGGEVYWLATNADRELTAREAALRPAREAALARQAAEARVYEATASLAAWQPPPRLAAATAALSEINATIAAKAAERGCASNCRALLQDQAVAAATELTAARAASEAERSALEQEVAEARAALAATPSPPVHATVAGALGVPAWAYDVTLAGLRGLVIMTASLVLGLVLHRHPASPIAPASPSSFDVARPAPQRDAKAEANSFALARLYPDENARVSLREVQHAYVDWCSERGTEPAPLRQVGEAVVDLIERGGYEIDASGNVVGLRVHAPLNLPVRVTS